MGQIENTLILGENAAVEFEWAEGGENGSGTAVEWGVVDWSGSLAEVGPGEGEGEGQWWRQPCDKCEKRGKKTSRHAVGAQGVSMCIG